jgi:phage terminase small subunit
MLERLGLLRETDALALEDLCETTVRWRMLRRKRDFRAAVASDRAREHMLKLLMQFGMTPSAATRVTATVKGEADPLEAWAAQ